MYNCRWHSSVSIQKRNQINVSFLRCTYNSSRHTPVDENMFYALKLNQNTKVLHRICNILYCILWSVFSLGAQPDTPVYA